MKNLSVSIVIPVWNGKLLLEKNLPLIFKAAENQSNSIKEIILVDDKSTDDSLSFIKKIKNRKLRVVAHKKNRGFSATVNTGVRAAKYELICLLNQDVSPSENFLKYVIPHFKDDRVFAVSLHEKGYGSATGKFAGGFLIHSGMPEKTISQETLWASGGSMVVRRSLWINLQGFDEKLFSPFYWEDVDLGYRAHKRGYKILWEPKANVIHKHESIININNFSKLKLNLIKERNYLIFIWKNITSQRLFKRHIKGLVRRIIMHPGYLKVVFLALVKFTEIKKARSKEKRESIISDEAIFEKFSK
jgi:GT2 family glycosyltransferase